MSSRALRVRGRGFGVGSSWGGGRPAERTDVASRALAVGALATAETVEARQTGCALRLVVQVRGGGEAARRTGRRRICPRRAEMPSIAIQRLLHPRIRALLPSRTAHTTAPPFVRVILGRHTCLFRGGPFHTEEPSGAGPSPRGQQIGRSWYFGPSIAIEPSRTIKRGCGRAIARTILATIAERTAVLRNEPSGSPIPARRAWSLLLTAAFAVVALRALVAGRSIGWVRDGRAAYAYIAGVAGVGGVAEPCGFAVVASLAGQAFCFLFSAFSRVIGPGGALHLCGAGWAVIANRANIGFIETSVLAGVAIRASETGDLALRALVLVHGTRGLVGLIGCAEITSTA